MPAAAWPRYTNAWTRQLQSADDLVCREQWSNAEATLSDLYGRWTEQQGWLHMIIVHQELDETEALLQRCIALAQQQDDAGLRSDIAELRTQFTLLSEMQRLTCGTSCSHFSLSSLFSSLIKVLMSLNCR